MARIKNISIKNFRSLESIESLEIPQLCALVGPNNVGKSNILEALKRVLEKDWVSKSSFEKSDIFFGDDERDIEITISLDPVIGYQRFKSSRSVDVSQLRYSYTKYKIGEEKGQRRLEKECLSQNSGKIFVPKRGDQSNTEPLTGIPNEVAEQIPLIYIGTDRSLKSQLPGSYNSLLGKIFEDINADFNNPENKISITGNDGQKIQIARLERFRALINEAVGLLKTNSFIELEKQIKHFAFKQLGLDISKDSEKLDFYFSPPSSEEFYKSLDLIVKEGSFQINACELGSGFQNVIVMAILKAFEERRKQGAIILIEEPEMYLHPQTQRSLYETLRDVSKTNQVIYTTHSPHFIGLADYQNVIIVKKSEGKTTTVKSSLSLAPAELEKFRRISNSSHNEMFFAKRLLLVEGDTEEHAFPEWGRKEGYDFDGLGVSVVEVSGKNNLIDYAKVAHSFGIPVGIVYDSDLPESDQQKKQAHEAANKLIAEWCKGKNCPCWEIPKDYEAYLRAQIGDTLWNSLCVRYADYGNKKQKQRLIAADAESKIPDLFKEIVKWLANDMPPQQTVIEKHDELLDDEIPF